MSAVRQLLGSLWAAVWLRWRVLAVRARRRLGGRDVAAAGTAYYLTDTEIPVEGFDYDTAELPAELAAGLATLRAELGARASGGSATGRARPRTRRRTVSIATASVLTLALLSGGAAALVAGTTGVPSVDRLLGIYEGGFEKPGSADYPDVQGRDLPLRSRGPVVELAAGSQRFVSVSYVVADGRVCTALTDSERDEPAGFVSCTTSAALATQLEQDGAKVMGVVGEADAVVLRGFVTGRVASLSGRGPSGPLEVRLGEAWTPDVPGGRPTRPFLAVGAPDHDGLVNPDDYAFRALNDDGSSTPISP